MIYNEGGEKLHTKTDMKLKSMDTNERESAPQATIIPFAKFLALKA